MFQDKVPVLHAVDIQQAHPWSAILVRSQTFEDILESNFALLDLHMHWLLREG